MKRMRQAFTLMEVNLAIFIMATGVLGMVSLYSLGFRESRQSEEDVASAGLADAFFAPLVAVLSATNLEWNAWCQAVPDISSDACNGLAPQKGGDNNGWTAYVTRIDADSDGIYESYRVDSGWQSLANGVFNGIKGNAPPGMSISLPPVSSDYCYGLVATRKGSTISLAFRASRRREALLSQPVYYTEVHFQGRTDQ